MWLQEPINFVSAVNPWDSCCYYESLLCVVNWTIPITKPWQHNLTPFTWFCYFSGYTFIYEIKYEWKLACFWSGRRWFLYEIETVPMSIINKNMGHVPKTKWTRFPWTAGQYLQLTDLNKFNVFRATLAYKVTTFEIDTWSLMQIKKNCTKFETQTHHLISCTGE